MSERIEVEFKGDIIKGVLIKEDEEYLTIKLSSGYNANLKKSEVKEIKREHSAKSVEHRDKKEKENNESKEKKEIIANKEKNNLPKITIIHTGGTIASKVDYRTGAVSTKFTPEELLGLYPELLDIADIDSKLVANIWSEDMRFDIYNLLLKEIEKAIGHGSIGVIIAHGTDTLHYSAAALQYASKNLSIPIILVVQIEQVQMLSQILIMLLIL